MFYWIGRTLSLVIARVFFGFRCYGKENIPGKKDGFILVSNHVSNFDPFLLGAGCQRRLSFMAKDTLFNIRLISILLKKVNAFPVKQKSADISALKEAIRRIKNGAGLVMFPEGTRSLNGNLQEPLAGIGFLAVKTGAPVVPAFIEGSNMVLPKGSRLPRMHKISLVFGEKMRFDSSLSYEEIADIIMRKVTALSRVKP